MQEDLWVYQALLKIIDNLNDRATGNYNAKVKEIQSLLIGGEAAGGVSGRHVRGSTSTTPSQPARVVNQLQFRIA